MLTDVLARIFRLREGIVSGPCFERRIIAGVICGVLIIMSAFQNLPVIESLSSLWGDIAGTTVAVHMPFADIGRLIAARFENLADALLVWREWHIVHKHACGSGKAAGQEGCSCRGTDWRCANGVGEVERFRGQAVYIGCDGVRVAVITSCFGTPLVGQNID